MTTHPRATLTTHACLLCGQQGQPVHAVTLTLEATDATPPHWPDQVEVNGWACLDTATCARMTAARRNGTTERMQ